MNLSITAVDIFINTLRPRRNKQHFADDIFKGIFFNENVWISIKISLKFVPKGPINNIPALVQIMAWCRSGDMPLSETMMVSLPRHICVTRPKWVKSSQSSHQTKFSFLKCYMHNSHMISIMSNHKTLRNILQFSPKIDKIVEIIPYEKQRKLIQHCPYFHGCWCLGDTRRQGISRHSIDGVLL